jgi:hypothetical protein
MAGFDAQVSPQHIGRRGLLEGGGHLRDGRQLDAGEAHEAFD